MLPASLKGYFVYLVECSDGTYYCGVTNNLEKRLWEHNEGLHEKAYTHNRRPVRLVFSEYHQDINEAIVREKQIKGWSRAKKQALISNQSDRLPGLSLRKS